MTKIITTDQVGSETTDINGSHSIDLGGHVVFGSHLKVIGPVTIEIAPGEINDIIYLHLKQDSIGGHVITFKTDQFEWGSGITPTLTTAPNSKDTFVLMRGMNNIIHVYSVEIDVKLPV